MKDKYNKQKHQQKCRS